MRFREKIFSIKSDQDFNNLAVEIFHYQYKYNPVYHDFVTALSVNPFSIRDFKHIPFLPVSFFKTQRIITGNYNPVRVSLSSGTTGMTRSRHQVVDISIYTQSLLTGFEQFYGVPSGYKILGLVPGREENPDSSLGFMVNLLMEIAHPGEYYFFLHDFPSLYNEIVSVKTDRRKIMLIGLTSALMDFSELFPIHFPDLVVMETGGMKGRRKEIIREELHVVLCERFGVKQIHSEYGMTELLSQAYSKGNGVFSCPKWMKILIRDATDPMTLMKPGKAGGINIIDLANFNSCSFIATQDLGKLHDDSRFEVLGRFDHSEMRGCNLMAV